MSIAGFLFYTICAYLAGKKRDKRQKATDMLSNLMLARYKDGKALSVEEITGLLIAALFAGER